MVHFSPPSVPLWGIIIPKHSLPCMLSVKVLTEAIQRGLDTRSARPLAHYWVLGAQRIRIIINWLIYCTHHFTYHLIHTLCLEYHSVAGWDQTGFWPFHERGNIQHLNGPADHHYSWWQENDDFSNCTNTRKSIFLGKFANSGLPRWMNGKIHCRWKANKGLCMQCQFTEYSS